MKRMLFSSFVPWKESPIYQTLSILAMSSLLPPDALFPLVNVATCRLDLPASLRGITRVDLPEFLIDRGSPPALAHG